MSIPSKEIRKAVFQALACARTAAAARQSAMEIAALTSDETIHSEANDISQAAYAASAHAWMAMIAMMSRNLEVAQNAARAAYNAKQHSLATAQHVFTMDLALVEDLEEENGEPPKESELLRLWQDFCSSLPHQFPVPDNFDQSLAPVIGD